MRQFRKRKLNNKGISLVEILVTVIIVALLTSPIINSFIQAITVNSKARLMQNGTAVAEDTAELFKVFDVDALVETYSSDLYKEAGVEVEKDNTGICTFKNIKMTGADGEEFLVDVKLNPSAYKSQGGKINVNDVDLPVFSGLYGSDCIMLYRQYAGSDDMLADLFKSKEANLPSDVLAKINTPEVRQSITKSTTIDIVCEYNANKYVYNIKMKIIYTYKKGDAKEAVEVEKELTKSYEAEEEKKIHTMYMLCPIFDRYSTEGVKNGYYDSTDEINVNYVFKSDSMYKHDINFYIVEQNMTHIDAKTGIESEMLQRISPDNVKIFKDKASNEYYTYGDYDNSLNNLKIYTNVGEMHKDFESTLTQGEHGTSISLYEMEVTVKLDDKVVSTFNTTK